jgi:hypothetical protein
MGWQFAGSFHVCFSKFRNVGEFVVNRVRAACQVDLVAIFRFVAVGFPGGPLKCTLDHEVGTLTSDPFVTCLAPPRGPGVVSSDGARRKLQPMLTSYAGEVLPALLPAMDDVFEEQTMGKCAMIHITDGESVAGTLRESAIPGTVSTYGDLMYGGPAPGGLDAEAWRETRARFMVEAGYATLEEARQYLKACDDTLAAFQQHEKVVIWLDHRLSDQLILIKVLDWFRRL